MAVLRVRLFRGDAARRLSPQAFVREVHDAAERARLPVVRGKGPKGRLRLTPGPPLTPGFVSRSEYVDFELSDPITGWEFSKRLQVELPDGIGVVWQRRMPPRSPHIRAAVVGVDYTIEGDFDAEKAVAFRQAPRWLMTRIRKNRERILDLKRSVARLTVEPGRLRLAINVQNEGTPKPEEIIEAVFQIPREEALTLPTERTAVLFAPPRQPASQMESL